MDFMKGIAILVKVNEMYTMPWSLLATVYWSRDGDEIGWSKLLLDSALECPYVYSAHPLLRGRLHLVRDSCRERVCYCSIDDTGAH